MTEDTDDELAFSCKPEPHVVISSWSERYFEARIAGRNSKSLPFGTGADQSTALTHLYKLVPAAINYPVEQEIRKDPALLCL